jgi:DNA-binding transcriptional LysR family regulator
LREATTDVQLDALEKSEIDAGFMIPPLPEKLQQLLCYQKILTEPLMLAAPEHLLPRDSHSKWKTVRICH